jgi:hypothetical protein
MTNPLLAPADPTAEQAQQAAGFDPSSIISAVESGLLGFLKMPMQQKLNDLPLQQFPHTLELRGQQPDAAGLDPLQLIAPVINGLGTLGNGQFSGVDPTQMLQGVSNAFDGTATPLQQARGSVAHDWKGGANAAADAKTHAAVANGAQVATQADGLRDNLSTSASDVAQARKRMIDIVDEFQAKMAAIDLSTPDGKAAAIAAANEANSESTAVMKDVQGKLGDQAQQVSAIGAPVQVANSPGGGMLGPLKGLAGLDPTGALNTVVSDPRLTPQGLLGNFMNLLFLPSTVTEMNQNLSATNATMSRTNSIMTGLGKTMTTTNGTIGNTNNIMTGLGKTIGATNGIMTGLGNTLGTTNSRMASLNGSMGTLHGDMTGLSGDMRGLSGDMGTLHGDMTGLSGDMGNLSDGMGNLSGDMGTLHGDMGDLNGSMGDLSGDMGTLHGDMGNLSGKLGTTNEQMQELNDTIPGPIDPPGLGNIGGGHDTPIVPW